MSRHYDKPSHYILNKCFNEILDDLPYPIQPTRCSDYMKIELKLILMYILSLMMKVKLVIQFLLAEKTILALHICYTGMNIMLLFIICLDCVVILLNIMDN